MTTQTSLLAGTEVTAAAAQGEGEAAAVQPPRVIGLDLSLVATGVAGGTWAATVRGGSLTEDATIAEQYLRIRRIRRGLLPYLDGAELVVIEGPSYGSKGGDAHERAHLWWTVVGACLAREIDVAVVAPTTLKVYATADGRASKEDVVQQVQRRRPDLLFRGNNEADALTLAAMGLDHLGHPPVALPATHRRALASVTWPEASA